MVVKYNTETKKYDQTLSVNDKVVSTLSTGKLNDNSHNERADNEILASGKANGFYMQTECQGTHKGIVSAHCKPQVVNSSEYVLIK